MKKLYFLAATLLFCCMVFAQDLRIPSTPAFSILDFEPSAVMRPSSMKKLSSDLLNSFDADGKLQMNIGIEVLPYWLKSRPDLSRKDYLEPNTIQTIIQSFSISAATVKDTVSGNNNLGAGFRFQIVKGKLDDEYAKTQERLKKIEFIVTAVASARANRRLTTTDTIIAVIKKDLSKEPKKLTDQEVEDVEKRASDLADRPYTNMKKFCEAINGSYTAEKSALIADEIKFINRRIGFNVEIAAASKFVTTRDRKAFQKGGVWLNISNYVSVNDAFTLTARLMRDSAVDTLSNNVDVGLSYIRQEKKLNVSLEAMGRWYQTEFPDTNILGQPITRVEKEFTYRIAAQISYVVIDEVSVNFSLGKDFKNPAFTTNGYFSMFGLNYTLFANDK
jgi:hypothetical protein